MNDSTPLWNMQVSLMNNTKLRADVISEYVLGMHVIPL